MPSPREAAQSLAREHLEGGRFLDWFESLYAGAGRDAGAIPWGDLKPNPNLVAWLDRYSVRGDGRRAMVVGCGLGDDAEELVQRGFAVTAFDVSPTAIAWARERFAGSAVDYQVADLLTLPANWRERFDFVFEAYTLQSLPRDWLPRAVKAVAGLVAQDGQILVIARGTDNGDESQGPPWPLRRTDLATFTQCGLAETTFADYHDKETPPVRRFRAVYVRQAS